ncbi:HAD family hydrolase [Aestuariibaculum sediminum]|uniref:HAD family phosphatase n=1 Tax=Aestuariibaculum sediminum TaxID=2770637 RepID=A0A8J6Q2B3_9FLAO|nr:HAD family phosphatase [Aestuariibaculum sediminum]MBD0831700.1 HAD family phosphatase [Aestuariibaculum sediminum]
MLKAVIFDMDGVIIDSEPLHYKAYHNMFKDVNVKVSPELYESFTGQSTLNVCKRVCDTFKLNETPETLVAIKRKHYEYIFDNDKEFDLIEGVLNLIKDYHANGLTLVLGSSASMPNIERIFKRFNLNPYFKAKLSGADLKASKPHPEIFIKAAEATGFLRHECMVIEDSTNGIEAAKSAGIFCTGYDSKHSKNQDYTKANLVIKSFDEISFERVKHLF